MPRELVLHFRMAIYLRRMRFQTTFMCYIKLKLECLFAQYELKLISLTNMADHEYTSIGKGSRYHGVPNHEVARSGAYRVQPASECTRNFVFGDARDQNVGRHKFELHRALELFTAHGHPKPDKYGSSEASTPKWSASEPPLITSEGWTRPSRAGWALPPEVPLAKVTNDVDTAADYLRESARPHSSDIFGVGRQSAAPSSPYQARGRQATRTIDSSEAARKYGGKFLW